MTSCGFRPSDIDEMTLFDVHMLFAYWRDFPPVHEILRSVHGLTRPASYKSPDNAGDPSGIGGLIARFPDGKVRSS